MRAHTAIFAAAALLFASGIASAQDNSLGSSIAAPDGGTTSNTTGSGGAVTGAARTDPMAKPAGEATTNSLVPFGVNPPIPDGSTPKIADSVTPPTTSERIVVPQGNFTSQNANPAGRTENPNGGPAGLPAGVNSPMPNGTTPATTGMRIGEPSQGTER